eukprot:TRINITY_DN4763_c0_g1_i1.p1 TRINITY_DN4763_c0_g1~~TRINITY_DN4763_c0_g1_i1.p1  ORF type:complete len:246 (-),score=42.92 TRINITY_DN4763_c0_g1_i1:128-865(-)
MSGWGSRPEPKHPVRVQKFNCDQSSPELHGKDALDSLGKSGALYGLTPLPDSRNVSAFTLQYPRGSLARSNPGSSCSHLKALQNTVTQLESDLAKLKKKDNLLESDLAKTNNDLAKLKKKDNRRKRQKILNAVQDGKAKVMAQCFPKGLSYEGKQILSLKQLNTEIDNAKLERDRKRFDGLVSLREDSYREVFGDYNQQLKDDQKERNFIHSSAKAVSRRLGKSTEAAHLFLKKLVDDEVVPWEY